ncbi:hypothetical protein CA13_37030 [Planctomycetes bacterium CA13]|uniref:Uncharacterized protein n=1 Tax=Novipirellula herctigrandis TaxID=2527986 RepID=A0A5C5Z5Y8_9BACT|nr:hypothetical protein CA13_37030 [Planctomycetes bacterium CA13]
MLELLDQASGLTSWLAKCQLKWAVCPGLVISKQMASVRLGARSWLADSERPTASRAEKGALAAWLLSRHKVSSKVQSRRKKKLPRLNATAFIFVLDRSDNLKRDDIYIFVIIQPSQTCEASESGKAPAHSAASSTATATAATAASAAIAAAAHHRSTR